MKYSVLIAFGILTGLGTQANAAEQCFEPKLVPAHWSCSSSDSRSADFTEGCVYKPDTIEQVEIVCPPKTGEWMPGSPLVSQSEACAAFGMKPSDVGGLVCKSKEQSQGTLVAGMKGSGLFSPNARGCRDSPCDTIAYRVLGYETDKTVYTCWSASQRKDFDRTDAVSHYACIKP